MATLDSDDLAAIQAMFDAQTAALPSNSSVQSACDSAISANSFLSGINSNVVGIVTDAHNASINAAQADTDIGAAQTAILAAIAALPTDTTIQADCAAAITADGNAAQANTSAGQAVSALTSLNSFLSGTDANVTTAMNAAVNARTDIDSTETAVLAAIAALPSAAAVQSAADAAITANTLVGGINTAIATLPDAAAVATAVGKTGFKLASDGLDVPLGSANVAAFKASAAAVQLGAVSSATSPTPTVFDCDTITDAASKFYVGRALVFTSGSLAKQAVAISDYSLVGGRGRFTVTELTSSPAAGDTFVIV